MVKDLYLLPGTMCDYRLWLPMRKHLQRINHSNVNCHDLSIEQLNTIEDIVEDIKQQLPNGKVNLLGFSLGGYLASAFAVKYPESVNRLFVVSNMPCALPQEEIRERQRTIDWIKRNGYRGIPTKRILAFIDKTARSNKQLIQCIIDMDKELGAKTLVHQLLATTLRKNLLEQLANFNFDKHFIVGENDHLVDIELLSSLERRESSCHLTVLKNTGHMLPLEQPEPLAKCVNKVVCK